MKVLYVPEINGSRVVPFLVAWIELLEGTPEESFVYGDRPLDGSRFLFDLQTFGRSGEGVDVDSISPAPFGGVVDDIQAAADDVNRRFLTPVEAAAFLGGLNSRTVTRWAREGYLPSYPIGEGKRRLWRFLESDLEHWMLSRRTGQISDFNACGHTLSAATDALFRRSHD